LLAHQIGEAEKDVLQARPLGKAINKVKNNSAELLA
jgi:hypothetical protein